MEEAKTATVRMNLELPSMPNFVRVAGIKDYSIPVGDLESKTVEMLAHAWATAFMAHCATQRSAPQDVQKLKVL